MFYVWQDFPSSFTTQFMSQISIENTVIGKVCHIEFHIYECSWLDTNDINARYLCGMMSVTCKHLLVEQHFQLNRHIFYMFLHSPEVRLSACRFLDKSVFPHIPRDCLKLLI